MCVHGGVVHMSHACGAQFCLYVGSGARTQVIKTAQQALYPPSLSLAHIVCLFQMCFTVKL